LPGFGRFVTDPELRSLTWLHGPADFDAVTQRRHHVHRTVSDFRLIPRRGRASDPCIATRHSRGLHVLAISPFVTHSASCLPSHRDGFAARPSRRQNGPRYYGGSDSRRPHTQAMGLSASYALPSRRSALNHVSRPMVALSVASAPPVIRGFAIGSKARRVLPSNQVRYPTDRQFVSSCSPSRLAATQLLSTSGLTTSPRADFHRADKASSRTHDPRIKSGGTKQSRGRSLWPLDCSAPLAMTA